MWNNLIKALQDIAEMLYSDLGSRIPDNWDLKSNYSFQYQNDGSLYEVTVRVPDYFKYIESGRRAGAKMPPRDAMLRFIEKRHITPYPDSRGRVPSLNSLAFLIGRKISRDGIPARPILQDSIVSLKTDIDTILTDAVTKDLNELTDKMLLSLKDE